nr:MAG TPA: hypothetical protein [Caudoviricetes sp.]
MYPAAIIQQPIITIALIIPVLLEPYSDGIPAFSAGLTLLAPYWHFQAFTILYVNYFAAGSAGRALPAASVFHPHRGYSIFLRNVINLRRQHTITISDFLSYFWNSFSYTHRCLIHYTSPIVTFRMRSFSTIWHPHSGQSIASYIFASVESPANTALIPPFIILSLTTYPVFGYTIFPHTSQVIFLMFFVSEGIKVPRFLHCLSLLKIFTFLC